jgi:hypothetical protein
MGFNRRKMEDQRRAAAETEVAERRATEALVLEEAERLVAVWNERRAKRMPMLSSPGIGAAIAAQGLHRQPEATRHQTDEMRSRDQADR